jgi:hypothetical protein
MLQAPATHSRPVRTAETQQLHEQVRVDQPGKSVAQQHQHPPTASQPAAPLGGAVARAKRRVISPPATQ